MLQPAPLEVPMLDLQATILRSPTPQGVGMIPERSPSPLRLERPPVPLLARRSSPLEVGGCCHEPSGAFSDRQHAGLLQPAHVPSSRGNIHARGRDIHVCARFPGAPVLAYVLASYRPRVLTFDPRTVPQTIPTALVLVGNRLLLAVSLVSCPRSRPRPRFRFRLRPRFSSVDHAVELLSSRWPTPFDVGFLEHSLRSLSPMELEPQLARRSSPFGGEATVMNPPVHATSLGLVGNWQLLVALLLRLACRPLWPDAGRHPRTRTPLSR
jgi:hypothetical protein